MPKIKPPRAINASIAALTSAFNKILTMNLAEPSGSSAAENPPANIRMFALAMCATIYFIDAAIAIVLNGTISATAPAASNAFAVSYSQFVPGNTGI